MAKFDKRLERQIVMPFVGKYKDEVESSPTYKSMKKSIENLDEIIAKYTKTDDRDGSEYIMWK